MHGRFGSKSWRGPMAGIETKAIRVLAVAAGLLLLQSPCAKAQTWQAPAIPAANLPPPSPYLPPSAVPLPLPPQQPLDPTFELGTRLWVSQGETSFKIDSHRLSPALGNPTSTLDYDGLDAVSGELTFRAKNETNTFAKGFIGGGGILDGSLDDKDFLAGQVKFSDTGSHIEGSDLVYGTIDIGQDFTLIDNGPRLVVGPFIGFNYWTETAEAFGARCKPDDVGGALCGPPGSVEVPFSVEGIKNNANWASLRVGTEVRATFWDRLTLIGDVAVLPVAYAFNNDSHLLRSDLGPTPNIQDSGTGWGYQLEGEARYDFSNCWSAGTGVRYWSASTDGKADFVHVHGNSKLEDYESDRLGVFADVTYRFMSF